MKTLIAIISMLFIAVCLYASMLLLLYPSEAYDALGVSEVKASPIVCRRNRSENMEMARINETWVITGANCAWGEW